MYYLQFSPRNPIIKGSKYPCPPPANQIATGKMINPIRNNLFTHLYDCFFDSIFLTNNIGILVCIGLAPLVMIHLPAAGMLLSLQFVVYIQLLSDAFPPGWLPVLLNSD